MNGKLVAIPKDSQKIVFMHSIDLLKKKLSLIFKSNGKDRYIYYEMTDLVDSIPRYHLHNVITAESFCPLFNPQDLNIHNDIEIKSVEDVADLIDDDYEVFVYDSPNQYKHDIYDYFVKQKICIKLIKQTKRYLI